MKKLLSAVLFLILLLQLTGCGVMAVNNIQQSRGNTMKYISGNPTSIKITGSMTKEQKKEALKRILKAKGYNADYINVHLKCIQWDIIDEDTIQDTIAFIDLLSGYGYKSTTGFIYHQKKITRSEFEQITKNIEMVQNDKNISDDDKGFFLNNCYWSTLSKPIAPSYIKLLEIDFEPVFTVWGRYVNNEEKMSTIFQNYQLLKSTGVLQDHTILKFEKKIDWEAPEVTDRVNNAVKFVNLMKDTNLYDSSKIDSYFSSIRWGNTKIDVAEVFKPVIEKGYFGYLFVGHLSEVSESDKSEIAAELIKIVDFMRQNNMSEDSIDSVLCNIEWGKYDETVAILKILIKNKKNAGDYFNVYVVDESYGYMTIYSAYEVVKNDSKIANKESEFIKRIEQMKRQDKTEKALEPINAILTAPARLPDAIFNAIFSSNQPH